MPTSHGSLLFKGRGPVAARLGRTSPGCGRPARCPSARRPRPSSARSTSPRPRRGASPATRGTRAARPAGRAADRRPRWRPASCRSATASDGGGSTRIPAAFSGLVGMKPSHGRIPHPGPSGSQTSVFGALTTTVADSARHLDVVAGPDDRDRTSLPAPAVRYEDAIESLDVSGLRVRWSADLGFATCRPGGGRAAPRRGRRRSPAPPGSRSTSRRSQLTDPVRTWLSAGAMDLWLSTSSRTCGRAWPTTSRATHASRSRRRPSTRAAVRPRPRSADAQLEADVAALFADVDVVLCPTTAVPAFAAEGPPPRRSPASRCTRPARWSRRSRCSPTCAGTRRSRCPPASPPTACRSASRSSPAATATRSPSAWPASSSRPNPGPGRRPPAFWPQ